MYVGENEKDCINELTEQYAELGNLKQAYSSDFLFMDKMRCPLKRAEKKYRFQILLKLATENLNEVIPQVFQIADGKKRKSVQVFVERNPQNLS